MNTVKPKIIAFMNAFSQGKSGGDMVFIEVAKRIKEFDKIVITSLLGKKLCQKSGLRGKFLITTTEQEFKNIILTYFKRTIKSFLLIFKIEKEDIFLGTSDFLPDVLPIFWLKVKNRKNKWIQHIFHLIPSSRKIPFCAQRLSFLLIKILADTIIVDNKLLKNDLIKMGFKIQKIFVNYPGANLKYLKSVKKDREGYNGIFMARLHPSKGIFDLIRIWKLVCQKKPEARLGVIGRGDERVINKLRSKIKLSGLEKNIDLLGFLEDDEAFGLIKASQVFVFPSHEEGFGIAPLEAQALGVPAVAWSLPVFAEVFPKGMIKVKKGNFKEFANKTIRLFQDKDFYDQLSRLAVENASRFNWDNVAKKQLRLLTENKIF